MQCNCKCNSLVTSFPSHQVSIFTHTHSIHFSAFSLHNPPCLTSHQHASRHGYNAVAVQYGAGTRSGQIGWKGGKGEILWAHTYPTVSSRPQGRCVQSFVPISSEMWICKGYKQTYKHSSLYIRLLSYLAYGSRTFLLNSNYNVFFLSVYGKNTSSLSILNAALSPSLVELYCNNLQASPTNTSSKIKNLCDDLYYICTMQILQKMNITHSRLNFLSITVLIKSQCM